MSSNFVINVPKLKSKNNYVKWAFAAKNLLMLKGMDKYLKHDPDADSTTVVDAKAKTQLILIIDSPLYVIRILVQIKNYSGFSRKISLLCHLISISLENCKHRSYTLMVVRSIIASQ